ncbi:hypothetical protein MMC13_008459 [Lambiella insularis]|nr:hypothetical protein [Lambiella insularis]
MLAIADLQIAADFNLDSIYTPSLPVALFLLGLGIGPLYLAPLSELHGRRVIYVASYIVFTIFNLGTAFASDMKSLSILRFLAGVAGSAGPCLGGSSLGDMFSHKNRGRAQAIYTFGTTNGPLLGGVLGGVLLNATGSWRWLLWIMTIVSGMTTLITILFLKETYGPYLLEQKAKKLRLATGNNAYTAVSGPQITSKARIQNAVVRPFRMLFTVPICSAMACYQSFIVGIYYLHLTTIPLLWGPSEHYDLFSYQWRQDLTGLAYLGGAIGGFVGMIIGAKFYGPSYTWMCKRYGENGIGRPEFRTPFMQLGMLITPFGLFLFGWTAEYHLHWAYPLLGAMIFCCGMLITHISIQTYMVDSFGKYAASALAALVVSRQLVGAVFSMFGFQLYHKLGYGWFVVSQYNNSGQ